MTAETNWKLLREYVAVSRFSRVRSSDHCSMSSAIATAPPAVATTPEATDSLACHGHAYRV